jgi:hypothetical protein
MSGKPTKPTVEKEGGASAPAKSKAAKAPKASRKPSGAFYELFESGLRHFLSRLFGILIVSFFFGCLITICQPPASLPVAGSSADGLAVMQVMAQAKASRGSDVAELSDSDVNAYLAQRTAPRGFLFDNLCRFDGVMISFQPKICHVFTRYLIFGYPIYLSGSYTARDDFGRPAFDNRGGAIGRLAVAPAFMGVAQYLFFGELWNGFGIERETLNRFRRVEFEQGVVRLDPEP